MESKHPTVSLIIPMYNEKEILPRVVPAVSTFMFETFGPSYEVLYVDDGSADGSAELVEKIAPRATRVLKNKPNRGKGHAVRTGVMAARGDMILFTDCDLAYGLPAVKALYDTLCAAAKPEPMAGAADRVAAKDRNAPPAGAARTPASPADAVPADRYTAPPAEKQPAGAAGATADRKTLDAAGVTADRKTLDAAGVTADRESARTAGATAAQIAGVVASRAAHPEGYAGYTPLRRLLSRGYRWLLRTFFGLPLGDSQSGLKGFYAAPAKAIFARCEVDRYAFDFEVIMVGRALGYSFVEMPACVLHNRPGKIRLLRDSVRMLRDLFGIRHRVRRLQKENAHTKSP